jgi:hypothetical protein
MGGGWVGGVEELVVVAGEVAFEAADGFEFGFAFAGFAV